MQKWLNTIVLLVKWQIKYSRTKQIAQKMLLSTFDLFLREILECTTILWTPCIFKKTVPQFLKTYTVHGARGERVEVNHKRTNVTGQFSRSKIIVDVIITWYSRCHNWLKLFLESLCFRWHCSIWPTELCTGLVRVLPIHRV